MKFGVWFDGKKVREKKLKKKYGSRRLGVGEEGK